MPHRKKQTQENVARARKKEKQPTNKPKNDESKPTSWGSKAWKGLKTAFWVWNAAKRCWEFLEGDLPDLTESGEDP